MPCRTVEFLRETGNWELLLGWAGREVGEDADGDALIQTIQDHMARSTAHATAPVPAPAPAS